jgi:uncharacterized protein (DUF1800 family)
MAERATMTSMEPRQRVGGAPGGKGEAAFRAAVRFGLGPRPGELERIRSAGPRDWLRAQLAAPPVRPPELAGLAESATTIADIARFERRRRMSAMDPDDPTSFVAKLRTEMLPQFHARIRAAVNSDRPFVERLVRFWSNHFTVSTAGARRSIATSCVAYEQEAIRARLGGSFGDMLTTVVGHPVMLLYLENERSVDPESGMAGKGDRGLNENLAREILELHTLGVDGGYDQDDVIALARLVSGWSVAGPDAQEAEPGTFLFRAQGHAPGTRYLLGRRYPDTGLERGRKALRDLALHPSTARHLARKLAVHFVADDPPEAAVAHLERVWRATGGDLPSVHGALLEIPGILEAPEPRIRAPEEFMLAALRGLDLPELAPELLAPLRRMGQFPFQAPSPAGWPDDSAHWAGPNALRQRIEWAHELGVRVGSRRDPTRTMAHMLPPDAIAVREAVRAAESARQGLALLVGSPAFQWR